MNDDFEVLDPSITPTQQWIHVKASCAESAAQEVAEELDQQRNQRPQAYTLTVRRILRAEPKTYRVVAQLQYEAYALDDETDPAE